MWLPPLSQKLPGGIRPAYSLIFENEYHVLKISMLKWHSAQFATCSTFHDGLAMNLRSSLAAFVSSASSMIIPVSVLVLEEQDDFRERPMSKQFRSVFYIL